MAHALQKYQSSFLSFSIFKQTYRHLELNLVRYQFNMIVQIKIQQHNILMLQNKHLVFILLVSLLAAFASIQLSSSSQPKEFQEWVLKYNIKFSTELQAAFRQRIFYHNLQIIIQHNQNPLRTYDKGLNQFSALTNSEFLNLYTQQISLEKFTNGRKKQFETVTIEDVDWVENGAVARVKNQGKCTGGSWAFSATGALEALSKIAYDKLRVFSDQQFIDCTNSFCSCSGGFTDMAFRYIQTQGLCEESQYPFVQIKDKCKPTQCTFKVSDYDYVDNCNGLGKLIAQRPISVAVDVSNWASYKSGVFSDCSTKMNAMALLVGVVEGNWKVKNSWGPEWGEQGYIRLSSGNTCGICSIGLYPLK